MKSIFLAVYLVISGVPSNPYGMNAQVHPTEEACWANFDDNKFYHLKEKNRNLYRVPGEVRTYVLENFGPILVTCIEVDLDVQMEQKR